MHGQNHIKFLILNQAVREVTARL